MNTSAKAKIEIEIDPESAKAVMEEIRAMQGGGGGGYVPGRVPGRVPIAPPAPGGGGGGGIGFGIPMSGTAVAAAAAAVAFKDSIRDAVGPLKTTINDLSNGLRRLTDFVSEKVLGATPGEAGMKSRAFEDAFERTREFGRETFGMASGAQLDSYFQMQMRLSLLREQGDRAAENRRLSWSPGLPSIGR